MDFKPEWWKRDTSGPEMVRLKNLIKEKVIIGKEGKGEAAEEYTPASLEEGDKAKEVWDIEAEAYDRTRKRYFLVKDQIESLVKMDDLEKKYESEMKKAPDDPVRMSDRALGELERIIMEERKKFENFVKETGLSDPDDLEKEFVNLQGALELGVADEEAQIERFNLS